MNWFTAALFPKATKAVVQRDNALTTAIKLGFTADEAFDLVIAAEKGFRERGQAIDYAEVIRRAAGITPNEYDAWLEAQVAEGPRVPSNPRSTPDGQPRAADGVPEWPDGPFCGGPEAFNTDVPLGERLLEGLDDE